MLYTIHTCIGILPMYVCYALWLNVYIKYKKWNILYKYVYITIGIVVYKYILFVFSDLFTILPFYCYQNLL